MQPDVTCFVGKNESGKTALLQALYEVNPPSPSSFDIDRDYPRWLLADDRKTGRTEEARPIRATFQIEESDAELVENSFGPGVLKSDSFTITLTYSKKSTVRCDVSEAAAIEYLLADEAPELFEKTTPQTLDEARAIIHEQRQAIAKQEDSPDVDLETLGAVESRFQTLGLHELTVWQAVVKLLRSRLPLFFYFDAYSMLPGRVDLAELVGERAATPGTDGNQTARALLELAGTDMQSLQNENYEVRTSELEAVSNTLTRQVFEYWTQSETLEVSIQIDPLLQPGQVPHIRRFLEVRVRDVRHGFTNNIDRRSHGFQWFFSFLAAFSEFEGYDRGLVLLLDEPGLALHGRAQADFLRLVNERLARSAQVIYTTHSPFLVETGQLERVRLVEDRGPEEGAKVSADIFTTDPDTLFPLQGALGYDIAQSLFIGDNNLLVEGTSDYTYLTVFSDYLREEGRTALDDRWRILPAGSSSNIPAFVSLLGRQLDVTVLVDAGAEGVQRLQNMVRQGLLKSPRLILVNEITGKKLSDIEDLFSRGDYLKLYNGAFSDNLRVAHLGPQERVLAAIEGVRSKFNHGRPADYLLRDRIKFLDAVTAETLRNFESLFDRINQTRT